MLEWRQQETQRDNNLGPYSHWWKEKELDFIPDGVIDKSEEPLLIPTRQPEWMKRQRGTSQWKSTTGAVSQQIQETFYSSGSIVPMLIDARNTKYSGVPYDLGTVVSELPEVRDDTVLVGIVDTGISLSNARFRLPDGKTRFVASWQQSAPFSDQSDLPCGQEIYADDINAALKANATRGQLGYVDEVAFNRKLCLTEALKLGGQRDLEMAAAHGTHVLDLAAGFDPDGPDADMAERLRLLAVNLPAQYLHGTAGGFLAYFAVHAVERLIFLADALWQKNNPTKPGGYPLIINFSYGMTAGPKDGTHIFERAIRDLLRERSQRLGTSVPVRLIMPAGNDNLERCTASAVLGKDGAVHTPTGYPAQPSITLPWRIRPADSTANFVEIWFEPKSPAEFDTLLQNLEVYVSPPGHADLALQLPLVLETYQDLGEFARVYINTSKTENGTRLALLVCVAPTMLDVPKAPIAPAGLWTLKIDYDGAPVDAAFYVQSDQSAVRTSKTAGRAYFDHEKYEMHLSTGAVADTYSYELDGSAPVFNDSWKDFGPVQRLGTHNALATINDSETYQDFTVIGGFDKSTGVPAIYSASTDGNPNDTTARFSISACYPSESGPSLFGLLASGARDGSVTAYRGTSMATALATRDAALAFLNPSGSSAIIGTERWFRERADRTMAQAEAGTFTDQWGAPLSWPKVNQLKSGSGHINAPDTDRRWRRLGGAK